MTETIRQLLLKVKALADRGVAGEADAAAEKLRMLMRKYKIRPDDLLAGDLVPLPFKWRTANTKTLGVYLAQMVAGRTDVPCRVVPRKRLIYIYLTRAQIREWRSLFVFYRRALARDERLFLAAFMHRQGFRPISKDKDAREMSFADTEALLRMMGYIQRVDRPRPERELECKEERLLPA